MKLRSLLHSLLLLGLLAFTPLLRAADNIPCQLGPVGGTFLAAPGSSGLRVLTVTPGGPGAVAGLQVGDFIYAAFGENFSPLSAYWSEGFKGCVQEYGEAIERAESGNVPLPLKVVRSGVGGLTVTVTLPNVGAFGAAYPLGSPKFEAIYEFAVGRMHTLTMAAGGSQVGDAAYTDGWFGLCLLSHTNWNDTTGPKPYRNSINKLRDFSVPRLTAAIMEPLEENQPGFVSPGLENWHLTMDAMFLAQYRLKSGDTSVDATLQRAAELLANRVQYWEQPDLGNGWHPNNPGVMGHGGVVGDYIHTGFIGAFNIISTHANLAMGMLKTAGANFSGPSGTNAGTLPHQTLTFEQRRQLSWTWMKSCTQVAPGSDLGNVGYFGIQEESGYDSSGRTAGSVAVFPLITSTPTADDTAKYNLMRGYLPRQWAKFQNSHVASIVGVNFYQMALPQLADRDQRFIMENLRHFYHLHRKADGTLDYFPGRMEFDSDTALGAENVALINTAVTRAIAGGGLPSFPNTNTTRLNSRMITPWVSWPTQEAHAGKISGSNATLEVEITDYAGVPVTSGLSATWTKVSGPGTVTFGNSNALTTTATFSADGVYRVQLVASTGGYTLTEPYDFTVVLNPTNPPAPVAPVVTVPPVSVTTNLGGSANFTVTATGVGPLVYQWRRNGVVESPWPAASSPDLVLNNLNGYFVGTAWDCVVTGPGGAVTSSVASLTISDGGILTAGGLWRSKYEGVSLNLDQLRAATIYPRFPDSSAVITNAEAPGGNTYTGSRWTGWLHVEATGDYRLLATSGGYGTTMEVFLSTDQHPANKTSRVFHNSGDGGSNRAWTAASASPYTPLTAGQRYYLEVQTATYGGDIDAVALQKQGDPLPANGTPGIPGSQLEYLTGGVFSDYANLINLAPTNIIASVSGTNLNLSWPTDHIGWRLLEQTNNLAAGVSQNTNDWATVSGSTATNQIVIPVDQAKPAKFYRLIFP